MKKQEKQKIRRITVKFCPHCRDERIIPIAGGEMGVFECVNCKFRSAIFPEREVELKKKTKKSRKIEKKTIKKGQKIKEE